MNVRLSNYTQATYCRFFEEIKIQPQVKPKTIMIYFEKAAVNTATSASPT